MSVFEEAKGLPQESRDFPGCPLPFFVSPVPLPATTSFSLSNPRPPSRKGRPCWNCPRSQNRRGIRVASTGTFFMFRTVIWSYRNHLVTGVYNVFTHDRDLWLSITPGSLFQTKPSSHPRLIELLWFSCGGGQALPGPFLTVPAHPHQQHLGCPETMCKLTCLELGQGGHSFAGDDEGVKLANSSRKRCEQVSP